MKKILWQTQFGYGRREKVFRLRPEQLAPVAGAARAATVALAALTLSACATTQTRYVETACLTQQQFDQLKAQEPPKIKAQLTGKADHDIGIIAGSAIRLRAWGEGLETILSGCVQK